MDNDTIREGALLPGVCCSGFGWQVLYVNPPEIGTVWGLCKNPDCPQYQKNIGPQDHYRGVKSIMRNELEATMDNDTNTERVIYPTQAERVTVKIATTPAPWEILTVEDARDLADTIARNAIDTWWLDEDWAPLLRAYAGAVDAMTAPTRLVYETQAVEGSA